MKDGWTPLFFACSYGHVDAAQLLLDNGAAVDRATSWGDTPLSVAASNGHSSRSSGSIRVVKGETNSV